MNIFEKASRLKLRFNVGSRLNLTVENLWDLPLTHTKGEDLDHIAIELQEQLSSNEKSFVVQQPIQYDNDVYYHNDNTTANLAAAAGYATNKYMDKQKQISSPAPVKVNPSTVPVSKPTKSKPSFSYLTSKSSSSSRSTRRK